jgi:hypothetical protein
MSALLEARGDYAGAEEAYRRADERGDGFGAFRLGCCYPGAAIGTAPRRPGRAPTTAAASRRGRPRPSF